MYNAKQAAWVAKCNECAEIKRKLVRWCALSAVAWILKEGVLCR